MPKPGDVIPEVRLEKIVGGGQALATLASGQKLFVWGGLTGETVSVKLTKAKSKLLEGVVAGVTAASTERITPRDAESYLSTSPWQMMSFAAEQRAKAELIEQAFALHGVEVPNAPAVWSDGVEYEYRNKLECSWYGHEVEGEEQLDLAFFRRGSKGKIPIETMSLARPEIMRLALAVRDRLRAQRVTARQLKTLLIRCDQMGQCVWQLYVKDDSIRIDTSIAATFPAMGGEIIYSDPKSPASRITKRLARFGDVTLHDTVQGVSFQYAAESFFQVNLPVYEQAVSDMRPWILPDAPSIDLYSGVGSIGLTIGGDECTLVEINREAVAEMKHNIARLGSNARAVYAPVETALNYISSDQTVIVDPPRAGLHADVVQRLLDVRPRRIVYLSCNPVTQARDVARLQAAFTIRHSLGYNFFPRTPHIEHLAVLDRTD